MKTKTKEKQQLVGWKSLLETVKKLRLPWIWVLIALVAHFFLEDFMLGLPDTTADLLSGTLTGEALTNAVMYYVLWGVFNTLMVVLQVQAQSYSVKRARETLWNKMLKSKMKFFDKNDPSDLMSAITSDTSSAVLQFVNIIIYFLPTVYYVVMALKRINEYHWVLALSCFAMLPIKYIYALVMGRQFQRNSAILYGRIGTLTGFLADRIMHLPLIKTYTNEEKEEHLGKETAFKLYKANMKMVHLDNASSAFIAVMEVLQKFIVVVIAVILLQQKKIDLAMWVAFFLFTQNLFPYMDQIFDTWVSLKSVHGTFERIVEIMQGEEEDTSAVLDFSKSGDIKFENVSFSYQDEDKCALKNVSFTVERGTSAAIVGLCGSGKTTTVSLFERLYSPDEGRILIGDTDIKDFSLSAYRKNISYVQQGADVFSGTLREALTYGIDRKISNEEIFTAAEKTGFSEYLQLCDNCLDTDLSSGRFSMSGGQSQRLVITREVLRNGDIILMDEPTSALDARVSEKIQSTMDSVFAGKTRILVTHDLSFAKKYDKIIVLKDGCLVGEGTHESLLESCEEYKHMNESAKEEAAV